eukprot:2990042-Prymnesium_polylepis.1
MLNGASLTAFDANSTPSDHSTLSFRCSLVEPRPGLDLLPATRTHHPHSHFASLPSSSKAPRIALMTSWLITWSNSPRKSVPSSRILRCVFSGIHHLIRL